MQKLHIFSKRRHLQVLPNPNGILNSMSQKAAGTFIMYVFSKKLYGFAEKLYVFSDKLYVRRSTVQYLSENIQEKKKHPV